MNWFRKEEKPTATTERQAPSVASPLPLATELNGSSAMPFENYETHRIAIDQDVNLFVRTAGDGHPLVLLHGWPQHGLMWHTIAPILEERFHVIVPDMRGAGGSSIPRGGYDKKTMAQDIAKVLDTLGVGDAYVAGYDLGSGVAYSLAAQFRNRIKKLAVMEFGLPGFGYETVMAPTPDWNNGSNWHLGFFTVPDVAEMAFKGKERELLSWFFWHIAHNADAVSPEHFEAYVRSVSRPGALRAGIEYYASVWQDSKDNTELGATPLDIPVLAVGGEASSAGYVEMLFQPVASNVTGYVVPKAGHWLGDENPTDLAVRLSEFFGS